MFVESSYNASQACRQYPNSINKQTILQKKVSCIKSKHSCLGYQIGISRKALNRMGEIQKKDIFGLMKISKRADHYFEWLGEKIQRDHYNVEGTKINIPQWKLAQDYGVRESTIRRYMNELKQLGIKVDTDGDPRDPYYKRGAKKQYIICFAEIFKIMADPLFKKRLAYIYRTKSSENRLQEETKKSVSSVEKIVDNQRIKKVCPLKNDRYKEDINIFYKKEKDKIEIHRRIAQKVSIMTEKEGSKDLSWLSKHTDQGKFSDLFSFEKILEFDRMDDDDKNVFLEFKQALAIQQKKDYPAYAWVKQEEASRALAVIDGLRKRKIPPF